MERIGRLRILMVIWEIKKIWKIGKLLPIIRHQTYWFYHCDLIGEYEEEKGEKDGGRLKHKE